MASDAAHAALKAERDAAFDRKDAELAELKEELHATTYKYKTLRVEVNDFKEAEGKMKQAHKALQEELAVNVQRYAVLKEHAQERLER
jgi:hypothetical protein